MKMFSKALVLAALSFSMLTPAYAQNEQSTVSTSDNVSHGEVKKIDKSTGKLTIKHGPLNNLGMDAMTMVFRVADPVMLDQVKVGDKIDFIAEEPNGQLTVVQLRRTVP